MDNYSTTVVGLDVHKESIVTGVLPPGADRSTEQAKIENHPAAIDWVPPDDTQAPGGDWLLDA